MHALAVVVGVVLVVAVLADLVNTLVTTSTSRASWWLTSRLYRWSWTGIHRLCCRMGNEARREAVLATFAPVSVLLLLAIWVFQQVIGFGLIWWGIGGVAGADTLLDSIYFSGVVYFTLGFGELVPTEIVPRIGALAEALAGVLTTALVIGYLPALYAAYSDRERHLLMLDDGSEQRITPTNLLISRTPNGDITEMYDFFQSWETWIAGVIETHSTFPMLVLFRSKDPGQHWITALGVITDAALQCLLIRGTERRAPYWTLRRAIRLFDQLTADVDLSAYVARQDELYSSDDSEAQFAQLYQNLADHGFDMAPMAEARASLLAVRRRYDAAMEYLIDTLLAPRGFWGHAIGHRAPGLSGLPDDPTEAPSTVTSDRQRPGRVGRPSR